MPNWQCLKVKKIFASPWVRLEQHLVRTPAGREFTHVVIHSGPSVMVVPVCDDGRIIVTREYRYPTRCWNYQLPGGGTDGARPDVAARRELREETGYVARRLEKLGRFVVYSGLSSEWCHVFLATGLRLESQQLEHSEQITVRAVSWPELERMIAANRFRDGMSLAALAMARHRLEAIVGKRREMGHR